MKKWSDFLFRKFSEKHFKFHWVNVSYLSKKRFWQRTTFVMCYSRNLCWNISSDCFAESLQNQILKIFCFSWLTFALTYVSLKAQIACRELIVYEIWFQNILFFLGWPLRWHTYRWKPRLLVENWKFTKLEFKIFRFFMADHCIDIHFAENTNCLLTTIFRDNYSGQSLRKIFLKFSATRPKPFFRESWPFYTFTFKSIARTIFRHMNSPKIWQFVDAMTLNVQCHCEP